MTNIEKNFMRQKPFSRAKKEDDFEERVIEVARISRVVKGGRRIRFRALVAVGNKKGRIGVGLSKANEVADAVNKATSKARKKMVDVPIIAGTIPYEMTSKFGAAKVILKPASEGTSIVAGGAVRTVLEICGIENVLAKILGSKSKVNNVFATILALSSFNDDIVQKIRNFKPREIKPAKQDNDKISENIKSQEEKKK